MRTSKAALYALGITLVSSILRAILHGPPTREQFLNTGAAMFIVAFVVMRFFVGAIKRRDGSNLE